jgi:nucleoside-diphosphate-sugar epimerase
VLFGGNQTRDWTYVGDLVKLIWEAALSLHEQRVNNETINASFGKSISLLGVVQQIEELTGKHINLQIAPQKSSDVMSCNNVSTKVREIFPSVEDTIFSDAMKSTIEFYLSEQT